MAAEGKDSDAGLAGPTGVAWVCMLLGWMFLSRMLREEMLSGGIVLGSALLKSLLQDLESADIEVDADLDDMRQ